MNIYFILLWVACYIWWAWAIATLPLTSRRSKAIILSYGAVMWGLVGFAMHNLIQGS